MLFRSGIDVELISQLSLAATGGIAPDLTVILDLPVEVGLRRAASRADGEDRFERKGAEFHTRLRNGFLTITKAEPGRCAVIDASASVDTVSQEISKVVAVRLKSTA